MPPAAVAGEALVVERVQPPQVVLVGLLVDEMVEASDLAPAELRWVVAQIRARLVAVAGMATVVSEVRVAVAVRAVVQQVVGEQVAPHPVVAERVEVALVHVAPDVPEAEGARGRQELGVRMVADGGQARIAVFLLGSRATRRSAGPLRYALAVAGSDVRVESAKTPHRSRRQSGLTRARFGRRPSPR